VAKERDNYLSQWQRALRLFANTRFPRSGISVMDSPDGQMPVLAPNPIDEAVCSQIPILLSDIRSMGGDVDDWLELHGHEGAVRIMNLDIGGGTTDIAVIEYRRDPEMRGVSASPSLISRLLHRDGFSIAGDLLVKKVIERMLLPLWLQASGIDQYSGIPDALRRIREFFKRPSDPSFISVDTRAQAKMARITRLVFVPLVNRWLGALAAAQRGSKDSWRALSPRECLEQQYLDENVVNELNRMVIELIRQTCSGGAYFEGTPFATDSGVFLHCDRAELEALVDEVFGGLYSYASTLVGRFDCHLVILSGKPSEIPRIRNSLLEHLALPTQRIISVKDFPAGTWYPFRTFDENRIVDAKTCTVVGAAVYQDIQNQADTALSIRDETEVHAPRPSFWGILNEHMDYDAFRRELIFRPGDCMGDGYQDKLSCAPVEVEVTIPCRIGRMLSAHPGLQPEPVYELRYRDPIDGRPVPPFRAKVVLEWFSAKGSGEALGLRAVRSIASADAQIDASAIELRLKTLPERSFWMDNPEFETGRFPEAPAQL
jgi:hypothetical protein